MIPGPGTGAEERGSERIGVQRGEGIREERGVERRGAQRGEGFREERGSERRGLERRGIQRGEGFRGVTDPGPMNPLRAPAWRCFCMLHPAVLPFS